MPFAVGVHGVCQQEVVVADLEKILFGRTIFYKPFIPAVHRTVPT